MWSVENAEMDVQRGHSLRLEILRDTLGDANCVEGCDGVWYRKATEILRANNINLYFFAGLVRQVLENGRKKNNNILLVGPTNCGKSFLLNPLEDIYVTFMNPTVGKYETCDGSSSQ